MNLWKGKIISFAYRFQKQARPYKEMMKVFSSALPLDCRKVLDIGCGSGAIIDLIKANSIGWRKNLDIVAFDRSISTLQYASEKHNQVSFLLSDVSQPLPFANRAFDLVTAGLSLQYAEHWDGVRWTDKAYRELFREIHRVLKPNSGRLVFSVNTPNPDFSIIAKKSWREIFLNLRLPLMLIVAIILVFQGRWLTKQAAIERFHYLPIEEVVAFLQVADFKNIRYSKTYAGLAWVVSCEK